MSTSPIALPDPIQWSEGMLLSPQHFQQADIYWSHQLQRRLELLTPNCWGLSSMSLDTAKLGAGIVRITALECVMPDGLTVTFPDEYAPRSLELDISDLLKTATGPLRIYLVVPRRGDHEASRDDPVRRYDGVGGSRVADANTGKGEVDVIRLRPRISLVAGQVAPRYCACPLLEIERDANQHVGISPYQPPMLNVGASTCFGDSGLSKKLNDLINALWLRLRELASLQEDRDDEASLSGSGRLLLDVARRMAAGLPQLAILTATPASHPEALYCALAQVVGHCAGIGANPEPLLMDPYRHEDCRAQFDAAIRFIRERIDAVVTTYERLAFDTIATDGPPAFARRLPDDSTDELVIELKPRSGQNAGQINTWLQNAFIASNDFPLKELGRHRNPGAEARTLTSEERVARNLPTEPLLYLLTNQTIEIEGRGSVAFRPATILRIVGATEHEQYRPAEILLYRFRSTKPTQVPTIGGQSTPVGRRHG